MDKVCDQRNPFLRDAKGSFTVEASLIFPILILTVMLMLFMGVYSYQKVALYHQASTLAQRIADAWPIHAHNQNDMDQTDGNVNGSLLIGHFTAAASSSAMEKLIQQEVNRIRPLPSGVIEWTVLTDGYVKPAGMVVIRVVLDRPLKIPMIDKWINRNPNVVFVSYAVDSAELVRSAQNQLDIDDR